MPENKCEMRPCTYLPGYVRCDLCDRQWRAGSGAMHPDTCVLHGDKTIIESTAEGHGGALWDAYKTADKVRKSDGQQAYEGDRIKQPGMFVTPWNELSEHCRDSWCHVAELRVRKAAGEDVTYDQVKRERTTRKAVRTTHYGEPIWPETPSEPSPYDCVRITQAPQNVHHYSRDAPHFTTTEDDYSALSGSPWLSSFVGVVVGLLAGFALAHWVF